MRCGRCSGLILIEYLDAEKVQRCISCGWRGYEPLPMTPERTRCFYCPQPPAPGKVACAACAEKSKRYRQEHPRKNRKTGPQLPCVQEVKA